jgi:hypothetical protein
MVLFKKGAGKGKKLTQLKADDDSGTDRNAQFAVQLQAGQEYIVRVRLYYAADTGSKVGVMYW